VQSAFSRVWLFGKRCPYGMCGGNLYVEEAPYGKKVTKCLLCSREVDPEKAIDDPNPRYGPRLPVRAHQ